MQAMRDFIVGCLSVLKTVGSPMLYRYPYRNSGEGLRKDWQSIADDIQSVIGKLEEAEHGKRRDDE